EWFEKGKRDLETARLLLAENHYTDIIAMHIQQAVEKYLKGYLLYHGWRLEKTHDIEKLIVDSMRYADVFEPYLEFARKITAYFKASRYPLDMPMDYPVKDIEESLKTAEELISLIKKIAV
ncbi:MAG: HEPN domain-containing protein, partial [Candidatus Brocadiales bacterium]